VLTARQDATKGGFERTNGGQPSFSGNIHAFEGVAMTFSRREFGRLALAAVPSVCTVDLGAQTASAKPNSVVRGVSIGMNVPYNFGGRNAPVDDIIGNCVALGISIVELRTQPVETFLGAPADAADLQKWRLGVSVDRVATLRRRFEDAGVAVQIMKVDGIFDMSDDVIEYQFRLAKALGAKAISTEIAEHGPERLGRFADQHRLFVGYHGHEKTSVADFERVFSLARFNAANLDLGHFVAGQNTSPVPFITAHHDRITHIHIKDRKLNNGPNMPFGQGDTPIAEVLRLIRDKRWNIQATIEFEYPVPPGSDRMTELKKTVAYCRSVLA
jgi:sugar phosphate isomerase/epimerase